MLSLGSDADTRVHRDSNLSLLAATGSGLVYGILLHRDIRRCTQTGCGAVVASYPLDAPHPGQWRFHS